MFGHKHYVPVLKGKRAEFPALGNLHSQEGLTPLFEAVPSAPSFDFVPRRMASVWNKKLPYFIDLVFVDDGEMPEEEAPNHPLRHCFNRVASEGQHAIPVTGTGRSPAYQTALRSVVGEQNRGYAIRLTLEDFQDEEELTDAIDALVDFVGVPRNQVDMIVDAGTQSDTSATHVTHSHLISLSVLPTVNDWRTLTVIAGAFPLSLAPLTRDVWNSVPRNDWRGWSALLHRHIPRRPAYGDYTIAHPDLPPTGQATTLAQLRYTTPDAFLIYKGHNVLTHANGYKQFFPICTSLIGRPEYSGQPFSYGDSEIYAKATTGGSSGNAETWRTIGTSHHLEMVKHQIASLAGT